MYDLCRSNIQLYMPRTCDECSVLILTANTALRRRFDNL